LLMRKFSYFRFLMADLGKYCFAFIVDPVYL
jgi:hypothetical protein